MEADPKEAAKAAKKAAAAAKAAAKKAAAAAPEAPVAGDFEAPAVETPVGEAAPPPAPAPAQVEKAAKAAPQRTGQVDLTRPVSAVQFHNAPGGPILTHTGVNAKHWAEKLRTPVEMRLVGPGVWIKAKGQEFIVPFANIVRVEFAKDEGEAG